MLKSVNTILELNMRGSSMESLNMTAPLPLPKIVTPFRVRMPDAVLNLVANNPCSSVQFKKISSFKLKQTSSFSVLIINSSLLLPGSIQYMLLHMSAELEVWKFFSSWVWLL